MHPKILTEDCISAIASGAFKLTFEEKYGLIQFLAQ